MNDTGPSSSITKRYRFTRPGEVEIEVRQFDSVDDAEAYAWECPKARVPRHHRASRPRRLGVRDRSRRAALT